MLIQNTKMAGESLTLRYATDPDTGDRKVVKGNAEGIFEVPDKDAALLLSTPGWRTARLARPLPEDEDLPTRVAAPVASTKPAIKPPTPGSSGSSRRTTEAAPEPVGAVPPVKTEETSKDDEEDAAEVAAQIEGLRTKADALALAELYSVKGLSEDMKLSEMKEKLVSELITEE